MRFFTQLETPSPAPQMELFAAVKQAIEGDETFMRLDPYYREGTLGAWNRLLSPVSMYHVQRQLIEAGRRLGFVPSGTATDANIMAFAAALARPSVIVNAPTFSAAKAAGLAGFLQSLGATPDELVNLSYANGWHQTRASYFRTVGARQGVNVQLVSVRATGQPIALGHPRTIHKMEVS